MKDIEELIQNVEEYQDVLVQKKLPSKKNTVVYAIVNNKPRVLKWYAPAFRKNMDQEYTILEKSSSKLSVPNVYEKDTDHNVLMMSYISGTNVCNLINDPQLCIEEKETIIDQLAQWFVQFHTYFKEKDTFYIRGDAILHNFIMTNKIWGVDFEEFRKGNPIQDIATLCSSILSTDPMFSTEKYRLTKRFIQMYQKNVTWDLQNIDDEVSYALLERIQWRPEDESILRKHAKKIGSKGL